MSKKSTENLVGEFGVRIEPLDNTQGPRQPRRVARPT